MRLACAIIAFAFVLQAVQLRLPGAAGHREPEAIIYSRYASAPVTADGNLTTAEWSNATVVDLSSVPLNSVTAYLMVQNNDTMLFMAYDVVGDTTASLNDSAAVSFDGDHNGAPTARGDGEYSVKGGNDTQCLPYVSPRCHYIYSGPGELWVPEDGMDQGLPFHAGLTAAIGFGGSPRTTESHRMYEFAIPLALLGQPNVLVQPGDVVGFYASRHTSPYIGVWDASTSRSDAWPDNAPLDPDGYGHLFLAARTGVVIVPAYSYKPAMPSQPAAQRFVVTNMGDSIDGFDLLTASPHGWGISLLDNLGNPMTNHGGNATYVDTGPIAPAASGVVQVVVTPPPSAAAGTVDAVSLEAMAWSNPAIKSMALLRAAVPLTVPWADDLESGAPGWYPLPRPVNDWALGTPNPTFPPGPPSSHSGTHVWGTNLDGNYTLSSFSILESPFIRIPDFASQARLTFWQWYKIAGPYGDGGWVEASVDGGPWTVIVPDGLYPGYRFGGESAFTGSSMGWIQADFNLTPYAGKSVAFRFILWDWLPNGVAPGWYLDDVAVQAVLPSAGVRLTPSYAFMAGFDNATLQVQIQVRNIGLSEDIYDLSYSQSLGWPVAFLDQANQPLTDNDKPKDGFVDTGAVLPGAYALVKLNVTIPANTTHGDIETVTAVFRSSQDITVAASGQYKFQLAIPLPYLDRIESGVNGWAVDSGSMWHQVNSCLPSAPPWSISYSPCHSWWYGQDAKGNYATGARTLGNLTSPPIELVGMTKAHMSLRYWYDTEPTLEYDQRWVTVRTDNGPWPAKGQPGTYQMPLVHGKIWLSSNFDFTPYIGHIIQIRFFFDSIDGQNNNYQGWYIDDVNVSEYTPGSIPPNIILTRPSLGDRWSGSQSQAVTWNATDEVDPSSSLLVWVNYSLTGSAPWSPVPGADGVPGDSSPVTWAPSCGGPTDVAMTLNATALNTFGLASSSGPVEILLDCTRPAILSYSPVGPTGVSVKSNVSVTFSEVMNISSVRAAFSMRAVQGWVKVNGTFSWIGNTLYFDPESDLSPSKEYQVNVTQAASDISTPGNGLAALSTWRFTTSSHADQPPTIRVTNPSGGEDWSGSTPTREVLKTIAWSVIDDFDPQLTLRVWVNYTIDGGGTWLSMGGAQPFNGTLGSLIWRVPCLNTTSAAVGIDAMDAGARKNDSHSGFFQLDCRPPSVMDHGPTGLVVPPSADVTLQFDEAMERSLTEAAFSLKTTSTWAPVAGRIEWASNIMSFRPESDLTRGTQYQANLTTLATDLSDPGNRLGSGLSWVFTVAPSAPPTVNKTTPANGATGVSSDLTSVDVTFSTGIISPPLLAVNITPFVDFTIDSSGAILVIHIWSKLSNDQKYKVTLKALYIADQFGNRLDGNGDGVGGDNYTFSFTTGSAGQQTFLSGLPAWVLMPPLIVAGFALALAIYSWRRRVEERKRRLRRRRKLRMQREEAMRQADEETGKESEGGPEAEKAEEEPSESLPPF